MRTFSTLIPAFFLALGVASCSNDNPDNTTPNVVDSVSLTVTHPNYANGMLSVILGKPVTLGVSAVQVSMNVPQAYTVELVPEDNDYFTFTGEGVLTGLKEGDDVGDITVRAVAASGKTLASKLIPVSVVGMLVSITGHENYVNDTFRVVANEEFLLTRSHVKVEPESPDYTIAFAPKNTRYFTFAANGILHGVLDGTGTIEALVLKGSDTVKVQPFSVKVTPKSSWVTAVSVEGSKTRYLISAQLSNLSLKESFKVEGGANKTLRFSSSDTEVATVDESTGVVNVNNVPSYAFIRATATDGSERADSIRVTTAKGFPGHSCDWNLCNILTDGNTKEDPRYVSCKVWDGDVATAWVYRLHLTFERPRYPGVTFMRGVYGKEWVDGDYNPEVPDWVLGGDPIPKKETSWGVWAANMDGSQHFKKLIVRRGCYTDERGRKIFQSGTVYLEFWDNEHKKLRMLGKHTFTDDPNSSEWIIDLTQGKYEVWSAASGDPVKEYEEAYPNGMPGTELQMMFSTEGASAASDGSYYWAIADVLLFE
ncbi:MAG: hypothetical protein LBG47_00665 [Prevotellaceae bacterium]|jgi:hypothetical protein|nr:hypothetical protein [Prevotellaceae bacterium]